MSDTREMSVEERIDQWLEESLVEIGDEPTDQEQVDRLLWALRSVRRRRAEVVELAKARFQLISTWAGQQTDQLDARAAHLERLLEGWAQAEHERTSRKTWQLPAGELRVRARTARAVAMSSAKDNLVISAVAKLVPEAVVTERRVLPGEVKKVATAGHVVDAVALGVDVPDGYEARQAVVADDPGEAEQSFVAVPGVVLLVPKPGRDGQQFTAVTS